jgi:DNA-binding GntR family transcriptional regulator
MSGPPTESTPPSAPEPPPVLAGSGPAAARVYTYVKQRLLDGTFPGGALLSENELSQQLGLSRTPVRQAFVQLEAEGLLELYPKRGALVVPVTAAEVADLFDARMALERHCLVRLAAGPPAPALRDELAAILDRQHDRLAAGDSAGFAAADRELHRAWVVATGNQVLLGLYDQLRDRQQRITARMLARDGAARSRELLAEHEEIVDALTRGRGDEAVTALERHLSAARAVVGR